jgi:hypothetical protein
VGAVGLVEVPSMFYSWIVLHRTGVLKLSEELLFIATIAIGAAVAYGISTQIHLADADFIRSSLKAIVRW